MKAFFTCEQKLGNTIFTFSQKVKVQIEKSQKEYYQREQMKAISDELGDDADEFQTYVEKIKQAKMPEEVDIKAMN